MRKIKLMALCMVLGVTALGTTAQILSSEQTINAAETAKITKAKAKEIALKKSDGGKVTKCELDYEDGVLVYEIKITNGKSIYSMDVDAKDGTITDYKKKTFKNKKADLSDAATISEKKAKAIALKKSGGGEVVKCELDYEDGILVYEIEIIDGNKEYSMDIGANNSKIYDYEVETIKNSSNSNVGSSKTISATKAKEIALKEAGGGKVVKCELDYDDGRKIYEVEIIDGNTEYEIELDANTGSVVSFDSEVEDWD